MSIRGERENDSPSGIIKKDLKYVSPADLVRSIGERFSLINWDELEDPQGYALELLRHLNLATSDYLQERRLIYSSIPTGYERYTYDSLNSCLRHHGHNVEDFTPLENRLLKLLMTNPNQTISKGEIEERVYDGETSNHSTNPKIRSQEMNRIEAAIKRLRRKLKPIFGEETPIVTKWGTGYAWVTEESNEMSDQETSPIP
jgi:DNA-binding winged helix-turn-helix (wHTH) protein